MAKVSRVVIAKTPEGYSLVVKFEGKVPISHEVLTFGEAVDILGRIQRFGV